MATRIDRSHARTGLFRTTLSDRRSPKGSGHEDDGIHWKQLLNGLSRRARDLAADLTRPPAAESDPHVLPAGPVDYRRIERIVLTDDVSRTLFEDYASHREGKRGDEEMGWVLLGLRQSDQAIALAALPATSDRDAGEAHVWITGPAHVLASRIVRQDDRRLSMLGVVHTHPGSLRHPSRGDLKGDREWVKQLRGGEGAFGIGTADADDEAAGTPTSSNPKPHMQCLGGLRFSWYTLAAGEQHYREAPVSLTIGPDLAKPLRSVWSEIEEHAERLERLARQQAKVKFEIAQGRDGPALTATVALADPGQAVRVAIEGKEVRYYYEAGGAAFQVDLPAASPDQGLYLLLAELAGKDCVTNESPERG